MWSPAINLFNPYYATLKSICEETQEHEIKVEEDKKTNNKQTTPTA